jgi:hypothetical protein
MKFEFYWQVFGKHSDIKFHENPSCGSRIVPCGRTDRNNEHMFCVRTSKCSEIYNVKEIFSEICTPSRRSRIPILEANVIQWQACADNEGRWNYGLNLGASSWWVFNATPRPLYPQEITSTHCAGGWVIPRAGLEEQTIYLSPPAFDPQTAQLTAVCLQYIGTICHRWPRGLRPLACWECGFESHLGNGSLSCKCCVLSGRGLCDGPIHHLGESYRGCMCHECYQAQR